MQIILLSQPIFSIEDAHEDIISGAAKVDVSPESCIFLRMHETLHKCSLVPKYHYTK